MARRDQLPPVEVDGVCSRETDDDGNNLWAQDHDDNDSTPLVCYLNDPMFDPFSYDATFAIAHALHHLVEVQKRTEIVGSELLDTLIKEVRFEGVTGLVDFYDASADPERLYHGDRRVGISLVLYNYNAHGVGTVPVGSWTPCTSNIVACS
jgi:hypothetical protein